jgi:uncharacterized repeat protein (TIGR01451 family)
VEEVFQQMSGATPRFFKEGQMELRCESKSFVKPAKMLLALGLAVVFLGGVWGFTQPVKAGGAGASFNRPVEVNLILDLTAEAVGPDGVPYDASDSDDIVYNGDVLTYTISVCNQGDEEAVGVVIEDTLPEDVLDYRTISCSGNCAKVVEAEDIPLPQGGTMLISITREIKWVGLSISDGACVTRTVSGKVIGQPKGTEFVNTAAVNVSSLDTNLELVVDLRIPDAGTGVSPVPSWLSSNLGTIDQDWGDFDRDGDLDLVLGSSLGATVYRNQDGNLKAYWHAPGYTGEDDPRYAYGVRWADLDGDPEQGLELIAVGNSVDHALDKPGVNYIYSYNKAAAEEEDRFVQTDVFTSEQQLVRVAPSDYDGDGDIDFVASTNAINTECAVRLYRNDGAADFTGEQDAANLDENVLCPCVTGDLGKYATAAIGAADYDGDGDVDLVVGVFPSRLQILDNYRGEQVITYTNPFAVGAVLEDDLEYIPYDLDWGDYDLDGDLDLAVAYPLQRRAYVYRNEAGVGGGRDLVVFDTLRTVSFMAPLSVDWGDFDGDGYLDLAVADSNIGIYLYDPVDGAFERLEDFGSPASGGQPWSVRGVDLGSRGNLDLAVANRDGYSRIFDTQASKLGSFINPVSELPMEGVAWGDWGSDGSLDLLFGIGDDTTESGSRLYLNDDGVFSEETPKITGFGPHYVAFGDLTGDGVLDIVVGKGSGLHVHDGSHVLEGAADWSIPESSNPARDAVSSLALADLDDDEELDVLVGRQNGAIHLYLVHYEGTELAASLVYTMTGNSKVNSVAVGDYDGDGYLDFAAGLENGAARVYRNFGDASFDLVWQHTAAASTREVAWADYDGDGDLDLAVGNYGAHDTVWENETGAFSSAPVWTSSTASDQTTSLAWGDWNNDGYPELAVGRANAPDVVYANLGSEPGRPRLVEIWRSSEPHTTTGIAWGDRDGDGDLDLAVSRRGAESGFYENTLVSPAHIPAFEPTATPLLNAPPYVYVERPGDTYDAYFYSSPEILGYPGSDPAHVVTVTYRLYDPEGYPVTSTRFDYSLDGEVWLPATPAPGSPPPITETNGSLAGVFVWDALADGAVGDSARIRVSVVGQEPTGPVQRAGGSGISPPFRVRARNCRWPTVFMEITESTSDNEEACYDFRPDFDGVGTLLFDWDLDGDGTYELIGKPSSAPISSCYSVPVYVTPTVRLRTPGCPGRPAYDRVVIDERVTLSQTVYLPLVLRAYGSSDGASGDGELPRWVREVNDRPRYPVAFSVPTLAPAAGDSPPTESPVHRSVRSSQPPVVDAADLPAGGLDGTSFGSGGIEAPLKVTRFVLGVNSQPAINSDGTRIAFWSTGEWTDQNDDGSIEIFVAEPGQLGWVTYTQVTSSTGSVLGGFSLSPSMDDAGNRLVFFSDMDTGRNGDYNFEVFMAEITTATDSMGISITQVTKTPRGINVLPDISGDGHYVAFASDNDLQAENVDQFPGGQLEIYRAEVTSDTLVFKRVTTTTGEYAINDKPSINEDGRFIAFISNQDLVGGQNGDGNLEVFVAEIGADGKVTYTQVTDSDGCINDEPSISADGTRIAYLSNCGASYDVRLWEGPGSGETITITASAEDEDYPSISADGTRVAYTRDRKLYLYDVIEDREIAPAASGPGGDGYNAYPVLSADGGSVAFNHDWDIYVARYPLANLALAKTVNSASTGVGEVFTYTLTVTNTGPSPAPSIVITDVLPPGVEPAYSYAADQGDDSDLILDLHLDDDSFVDSSGNDNNASCPSGSCPDIIPGKVGNAARFNGAGEYDDFLRIVSVNDFPDAEITSMFWARTSDTSRNGSLFSYAASGSWAGNEFWILNQRNLRATINYPYFYSYADITGGEWHHVAVTWRSSDGAIRFYIDGELKASGVLRRGYKIQGGGTLVLAQDQDCVGGCFSNSQSFWGDLDEVAVYRRALTDWEIYNIYVGQGGEPNPDSYKSPPMAQPAGASGWSAISWMPSRPVGVDLPDYGRADPVGYLTGTVAMTGNVLLMHFNEPSGYKGFLDTSGAGNDGKCTGDACPTAGVPGKVGNALAFDGADDHVNAGSDENLEMDDRVSIEAWVYPTDPSGGIIVNKEGEYEVAVREGTVQWAFANTGSYWDWVDTGEAVLLDDWAHVAVIYDVGIAGTGVVTTYVNGAPVHTATVTGTIGDVHTNYNELWIGGRQGGSQFFAGSIDEVAIFDRALTEEEVLNHYLRGALKVEFEVKSCDDPGCDVETFGGSYPDHTNPEVFPPAFAIDVPDNPYFQYKVASFNASVSSTEYKPGLQWVEVHPWVQCSSGATVTCTIGTQVAPLERDASATVVLPVITPKTAVFTSSNVTLANAAIVRSPASDHTPIDNEDQAASELHSDCWVRLGDDDVYFVNLQAAVDAASENSTLRVAGTCGGVERRAGTVQTLYLSKTLTIQGGYDSLQGLDGPPDPAAYTTTLSAGGQGGVVVIGGGAPTLEGLHITGGAPITDSVGGGIRVVGAAATISGCRVYSNTAEAYGGGVHAITSTATISGCLVYSNTAASAGGGVYLENSDSVLSDNVIFSNEAGDYGGGVYLEQGDAVFVDNVIRSNTAAGESGGGLYVLDSTGAFTNTVLATNQAESGGGMYVVGSETQLGMLHTTIVGNIATLNDVGSGDGIYVQSASVALTNTIVADHNNGYYSKGIYGPAGFVSLESTLWWDNRTDCDISQDTSRDYVGNPFFEDASAGNYRISSNSAAVDKAIGFGVASDLDGHPRGVMPDLGAYESPHSLAVTKVADSSTVEPGDDLTYTVYITNTGYLSLTSLVLTDTLPGGVTLDPLPPLGVLTWTLDALLPGETWSPLPVMAGEVLDVYTGVLTNTVTIRASELVTASASVQVTVSAYEGVLPWSENFALPNGTTHDAGDTAWSTNASNLGPMAVFSVQDGEFKSSNTDYVGEWVSGAINISETNGVDVSLRIRGEGDLEEIGRWRDYIRIYCRLDGDPKDEEFIAEEKGSFNDEDWLVVRDYGIGGGAETIQIVIRTRTTGADEAYYWDDVTVDLFPEMDVGGNGVSIADGSTSPLTADGTDFGKATVGLDAITHTFTITNTGNGTLHLDGDPRVQILGDPVQVFTVTQPPSTTVAASGGTTMFTVRFDPVGPITYTAMISVSNNDTDENPYTFAIRGVGTEPEMDVGGAGGLIEAGDLDPVGDAGADFGSVTVTGTNSITHTFTITNTGSGTLHLDGDPRVQVLDDPAQVFTVTRQPSAMVTASGGTTTFTVRFDPASAITYTATISISNNDANEDPYTFAIRGVGTEPEMDVGGNGVSIASGSDTPLATDGTDFGSVIVTGTHSITQTFAITNTGNGVLHLDGDPRVQVLDDPAQVFTVIRQPSTTVDAFGGTTTFTVRFDPGDNVTYTATVRIANDDADESPYTFVIRGTGIEPEMDVGWNGASIPKGSTEPLPENGTDFGSVIVTGTNSIPHTFTITNAGNGALHLYGVPSVQITGDPAGVFTVTQPLSTTVTAFGGTTTFTIRFDPVNDVTYAATVHIANDDWNNNPYQFVIQGTGVEPEMDVGWNGVSITDGSTTTLTTNGTDFGSAIVTGTHSITHTFTITNTGDGILSLDGDPRVQILDDTAGVFTVTQPPSTTVDAFGGTTTFAIKFDPIGATTYTATVSIANDDPNKNPYTFVIQGTGTQ